MSMAGHKMVWKRRISFTHDVDIGRPEGLVVLVGGVA